MKRRELLEDIGCFLIPHAEIKDPLARHILLETKG